MPRLIRAYQEGKLKVIGNGRNVADLTSVSNVADAIVLSMNAGPQAINGTYNISNGEPVLLWKAIGEVLNALGHQLPQGKVPLGIALFAARMMETKARLTGMKEPSLTRYGVGTLTQSLTMDISAAREKLGYAPKMNTQEAIAEFVKWYKENENG
jgi:nucleoside-diphosphate-sugar epimerase